MTWTMGSLFDGIGGFVVAGQLVGLQTLWASEIDKHALSVTRLRFPEVQHLGDIRNINGGMIPPVHLITFGSPCQDLSVAGSRRGLSGERSSLFLEAVRVIREMREATDGVFPEFCVWENVPGAFSSSGGRDFAGVLGALAECGALDIGWRVLDALHAGVPQRRKRIVLVADFRGRRTTQILFEPKGLPWHPAAGRIEGQDTSASLGEGADESGGKGVVIAPSYAAAITTRTGKIQDPFVETLLPVQLYDMTHADEVIRPVTGGAPTLQQRMGTGGNQVPILLHPVAGRDWVTSLTSSYGTGGPDAAHAQAGHLVPVAVDVRHLRETVTGSAWAVRKLTPRECERLMGQDDDWTLRGMSEAGQTYEISDSARYRLLGNGIVPTPFAEIMAYIVDELEAARHGLASGD